MRRRCSSTITASTSCRSRWRASITIYGDGRQTRSFCYVDDMVEALIRLLDSPGNFTGPVNLGNPTEITILELARQIIAMTGYLSELVFCPLPSTIRCSVGPT